MGFYDNKLFIPFSFGIFLVLQTKIGPDKDVIVINDFPKPPGVHHNDFLTAFVSYLILFVIPFCFIVKSN